MCGGNYPLCIYRYIYLFGGFRPPGGGRGGRGGGGGVEAKIHFFKSIPACKYQEQFVLLLQMA